MLKRCIALVLCAAVSAPALSGGWGGGYHYGGHYKHRSHGGSGDALVAGLLIGGLVGYFVGEDRHYRRRGHTSYYYRYDPWYDDYGYYSHRGNDYRDRIYYREYVPASPPRRVVVRETPRVSGHDCSMTREYTTTIEIDGRMREAYGTRCLTTDGSWVLGPPKLVPEFN